MADPWNPCPLLSSGEDDLFPEPPEKHLKLTVVIPARDEADQIAHAIAALARQVTRAGTRVDPTIYEVLVLANNCQDNTADVARAAAAAVPWLRLHVCERTLPAGIAHVGTARRLLMDAAARRLHAVGASPGVIASTDADTLVAPTWIHATLAEIRAGADVVGGRILVNPSELAGLEPGARRFHLQDVTYRTLASELRARLDPDPADPWPRHFQHFGPSIAVRLDAYRHAGGLPVQPALEDVALYDALRRVDARIRHAPGVRVMTSARQSTRTTFGFGLQLERWAALYAAGGSLLVESPDALEQRILAERDLRGLWQRARRDSFWMPGDVLLLAHRLGIDAAALDEWLSVPQTFGCLLEQVSVAQEDAGAWEQRWPQVEIRTAINGLRQRLAQLRVQPLPVRALQQIQAVDILSAAG